MNSKLKREKRFRRHKRVRAKILSISNLPRLCVFKSNKHIFAQIIDDQKGRTLAAASDQELKKLKTLSGRKAKSGLKAKTATKNSELKKGIRTGKVAIAYEVGKLIAKKALSKKIEKIVFDKGGYRYQGRVKALAEGAREEGLIF